MAIKSKKLKDSARDQVCTLNVAAVCNCDPSTTVLCHIKTEGGCMGGKPPDISAAFGCSMCHEWLDQNKGTEEDRLYYTRRGIIRTQLKWIEMGIMCIK